VPSLEWHAPPACPDSDAVGVRLRALWGEEDPGSESMGRVLGRITPRSGGWLLELTIDERGRRFVRQIRAAQCDDLADAAAIAIALAFGRELHVENGERSEPAPSRRNDSNEPDSSAANRAASEPRVSDAGASVAVPAANSGPSWLSELSFAALAGATLDVNAFPEPSPGLSLEGRARSASFAAGVYGLASPGAEARVAPGGAVDFGLLAGGVRACYLPSTGSASAAACLGVEAGQLRVNGVGLSTSRSLLDAWMAPSAALELGAPLGSVLQARMRTEGLLPLARKHYVVDGTEPVYQPPGLALRFYVGLQLATD